MIKNCLILLFILSLSRFCVAQLPTCAQSGCPAGGVWGEWKTIGNSVCDMDCGGCGTLYQSRECISEPVCSCTGSSTRYVACNFETCKYPIQKACCTPFLPMVINGVSTCGPVPKSLDSSACCPQSPLMSEWTGWQYVNSQWTRSRNCLTASIGCPCTEQTLTISQAECPCSQPLDATSSCSNDAVGEPIYYRTLAVDNPTCTANLVMIGINQTGKVYCKDLTTTAYKDSYGAELGYQGVMLLMKEVGGGCARDIVFDCAAGTDTNNRQNASFTCDTASGNWIYDYTGKQVSEIVQGVWR